MDQKLKTKKGREAWVKKAVEAGVTEAEARDTMQKMVSASDFGKSAPKPSKPSSLGRKPKLTPQIPLAFSSVFHCLQPKRRLKSRHR